MSGPGPLNYNDLRVGDQLGPVELKVTHEMNRAQLEWIDSDGGYVPFGIHDQWVEPSILARNYAPLLRAHHEAQGVVHVMCEFQTVRSVRIGERLQITGRIAEKYIKRGRPYIVVESVTTDEEGNEVSRERNTLITSMRSGE